MLLPLRMLYVHADLLDLASLSQVPDENTIEFDLVGCFWANAKIYGIHCLLFACLN